MSIQEYLAQHITELFAVALSCLMHMRILIRLSARFSVASTVIYQMIIAIQHAMLDHHHLTDTDKQRRVSVTTGAPIVQRGSYGLSQRVKIGNNIERGVRPTSLTDACVLHAIDNEDWETYEILLNAFQHGQRVANDRDN
jgi:hypothetical protein